jgi:hypothetical protein
MAQLVSRMRSEQQAANEQQAEQNRERGEPP